jgi:hypothetical protein
VTAFGRLTAARIALAGSFAFDVVPYLKRSKESMTYYTIPVIQLLAMPVGNWYILDPKIAALPCFGRMLNRKILEVFFLEIDSDDCLEGAARQGVKLGC